ncbi:bifunctional diguanylate cyclase/phosphodiesterase [Terasakiella sp. SH-1]|uniref:putative bifunctional diguanylate cyclase/phosphodiesterase n=1 Tax=Terasakiella sp. SH-1 TaxID=2560057 RepID=UPI001073D6C4|nr:bifunctional diguanylate cyclase/phosphodiesterase [Terasakiella sp. SH-1]
MVSGTYSGDADFGGSESVSDLKKQINVLQDALKTSENRLGEMMGNLPVTLFRLERSSDGTISFPYINAGSAALMGADSEGLLANQNGFLGLLSTQDKFRLMRCLSRSIKKQTPIDEEICLNVSALNKVWVRVFANIHEMNEDKTVWDGAAIDVSGQHMLDERLHYLAYHDETTKLPNRLAMEEYLNGLFAQPVETSFAVLALAIDRLDLVNDTLGMETANRLVITVAEHLQKMLPHGTFLAHPRAENFCIVWEGFDSDQEVANISNKILEALKIPFDIGARQLDISVSLGISIAYRDGEDADALMMNADTAMRRAHLTSPGGYRFYVEEMNTRALRVLAYENRLRKAISNKEFVPFFQPLVNIQTGEIAAMEALARWKHPRLGLVGPGEFIPVAEEAGLIGEICHQILYSTCATAKKWLDDGLKPIPLAVNISWRQFAQPERLLLLMNRVLQETGMPPELVELELTESSVMEEPDSAIRTLNDLREFGVTASIDDFGTGYSSLSYLKRLPISKLKIDRAFIHEVTENERDGAIVDAIIQLARALGLKTVAEGIETRQQYEYLRNKGCDFAQGFFFSKPVPAEEMEKMLIKGSFPTS